MGGKVGLEKRDTVGVGRAVEGASVPEGEIVVQSSGQGRVSLRIGNRGREG